MKSKTLKADALLLLAALIWGVAFVAQRVGMQHMGPLTFNGIRFALGSLVLLPFFLRQRRQESPPQTLPRRVWVGSVVAGILLFAGATLQQIGIIYTAAGKAGFITGLYVIFVPILGLFLGQRAGRGTWAGAALALVGMYLLSVTGAFEVNTGDLYVLLGAVVWGFHVQIIARCSHRAGALRLAILQYSLTAALSLILGLLFEEISPAAWGDAAIAILYAGALSVGVGYTLQIVAQKDAPPAHAAILLSMESVFAVLGGWLILGESLTPRGILGCGLMLAGMWVSQLAGGERMTGSG